MDTLEGDSKKAKRLLKWKPSHDIHSLIKDMIKFELTQIINEKKT